MKYHIGGFINGNIETINSDIEGLGNSKQNKIQVTDTIQISKLKAQYVTMTLKVSDLETRLNGKQTKITDNSYLSISDVSGLSSALENVQPSDININDVLNLQTTLDGKQTKITDNSYLSISDVSRLTAALENTQPTDININDVINLQTTLEGKQNLITKNDSFIIDSMYVTPLGTKTLVNPTQTGELRASILTVEDDTLGVVNVGDSISSITSDLINKQTKITDNNFISISDVSGLTTTLDGKQATLDKDTDILVDTITCGSITANLGATIRATTLIATDNLYYGPIQN
jgi:hypothetical protein